MCKLLKKVVAYFKLEPETAQPKKTREITPREVLAIDLRFN